MQDITVFKNDRTGVSPVIGVILMVAVTVIIAAVIGSTALGLGDSVSKTPPQVSFDTEQKNMDISENDGGGGTDGEIKEYTVVTITHNGGDDIDTDNIKTEINGEPAYATLLPPEDFYGGAVNSNNPAKADPINPWDNVGDSISSGEQTNLYLATSYLENNNYVVGEDDINIEHDFNGDDCLLYLADNRLREGQGARLTEGDEVRITWESGDQSQTLLEEEIK